MKSTHLFHRNTQRVIVDFKLLDGSTFQVHADYCPVCGRVVPDPGELLSFYNALSRSAQVVDQAKRQAKESEVADHESNKG